MEQLTKVAYVAERDVDLLLLEELNVNAHFGEWFYSRLASTPSTKSVCKGAWHSITNAKLGESDLVAIYNGDLAILIENKIDAQEQITRHFS